MLTVLGRMRLLGSVVLVGAAIFLLSLQTGLRADEIAGRAKALHRRVVVLDTHDDTPQRMVHEKFDLGHRDPLGNIDIPRMREGGLDGLFFSIWTPSKVPGPQSIKAALKQIDTVYEQARKHPNDLVLAVTAADVRRAHAQGKIAALMGMEGGHIIDDDLGVLRMFAALGIRYLTLTHSQNNNWADASTDKPKHNGLTEFGKNVVRELNRLGVMVDISHVSDKTFYDVLAVTKSPVLASHSSCRALCDVPRNMSDDMIRALAKNGGVMHINFNVGFLSPIEAGMSRQVRAEFQRRIDEAVKPCGANEACEIRSWQQVNDAMVKEGKLPAVSWERIVDHIDHVVKLVGPDHVGLGSDFDGATMPVGMEDATMLPKITEALLRKGYSQKDIEKILGGNLLRVMENVERVSHAAQARGAR